METRSNHILVGGVVLVLLAALVGFMVWMARLSNGNDQLFDIFFKQSVEGLSKGSSVTFAGVPVGQIKEIALLPAQPEFVRVRIAVNEDTPVLQGTTATISGVGFTGVSQINLVGAMKGMPKIAEPGPYGAPVIPTKPGAIGELLNSAPKLLQEVTVLADRMGELLDDDNQKSMKHILRNLDTLSGSLSDQSKDLRPALADARVAIRQAGDAAQKIGALADTANANLGPVSEQLKHTVASADRSMVALEGAINDARPGIKGFSNQTLPEVSQLVRNLNDMADALTAVATKLDRGGAGAVIGGGCLPDYKPGRH
jgi:phospholipid/cholesterol/gamma-HCH transport system substrate-binding protein